MWMMGYNDGGEISLPTTNNNDPFSASRKLRPLIPRPPPPHHHHQPRHGHNQPRSGHSVNNVDNFLHSATMAEQSKREFNVAQQVVVSSRWNPTPEQLRTLEDLWRRGTRTPSADEIQQITSRLRRYGKIEGKNVFYWFQNHKARERQKRRRQMESGGGCHDQEEHEPSETDNLGHKDADTDTGGSSKTASGDVRRSNNDTPIIINNNWEAAIEKEGKLAGGGGGGGGTVSASSSAAVSVSSSSLVVAPLRMKKPQPNDNNSVPNHNSCCRDQEDNNDDENDDDNDDDGFNVPVGWHNLTATPPGTFFTYSCRPLLVPPRPISIAAPRSSCSPTSSSLMPNHDFQTLQLFPLRSCLDGEEDYAKGFGGRRDDEDDDTNRGTGVEFSSSNVQFFEFLPLKN